MLIPVTALEFLGFTVEAEVQAFKIPIEKLTKFGSLREPTLQIRKKVPVKTLERFQGKSVSFAFVVPVPKLFIRNICWNHIFSLQIFR